MSTATVDIMVGMNRVTEAVEKIKNDMPQKFPEAASIGDAVRQGDVYIQLIEPVTAAPEFYVEQKKVSYPVQLAPGNTKGSRHLLEESPGAVVYVNEIQAAFFDAEAFVADDRDGRMALWELRAKYRTKINEIATRIAGEDDTAANKWNSKTQDIRMELTDVLSLTGPIFVLKNPGVVSHPEHGDWHLPAGCYRVVFQRTVDNAQNVSRVLD